MLCGAVILTLVGGSAHARPDLVELTVSVSQHGRTLAVTDTVLNRGVASAAGSTTGYFLARKQLASRRVAPLRSHSSSRRTSTFVIPARVAPGSWRLTACADVRSRVRESNERNNCRSASRLVEVGDLAPPRFAGLSRATTCIPGPVGGRVRNTPYALAWGPASDNVTPQSDIVYEIYEANTMGTEDFAHPSYVSDPGATTFVTPPLPDNVSHYFVVRARDAAGNRDRNKVERLGQNLCL
jgi:CARDB